jgi:carbonic anhydrase
LSNWLGSAGNSPPLHGWVYDIHTGRLKTVTKMEPGHPLDPIYSFEFPEE